MSGPQCCANPPTLSSTSGIGCVEKFGGLNTYITGSPDSKLGIILLSDVYGYEAPNLRKLADKVAAVGFYVLVPDFFHGEPFVHENLEKPVTVWIQSHRPEPKGVEDAKSIIAALNSKGITVIGAAGFCWGAKVVTLLAKSDYLKAGVLLHPSFVTVDDIKEIKAHMSILGAEIDQYGPPALLKQFEEVLSTKPEIDGFVKIFPGVVHGWTVRYNVEDEAAVKAANEAHEDMIDWFTKYIK
ncbi:hypothetical protein GIB67_041445 [Kingdonia uniflora]|uniref:Dienelactone hydrolase domain-containing protein n=1 Tax=Kingdonia uniflora TaxID=39325 RepID=A0A7J7LRS6_9MAGN|nr:hypothetical protein GIB67_041445 [Kingdonia uniflora]